MEKLSKEEVKFLNENKLYIINQDYVTVAHNLNQYEEEASSLLNIFKQIGVDLYKYPKFKRGSKVKIIEPELAYPGYVNFFLKHNLPLDWIDIYKNNITRSIHHVTPPKKGDIGEVLFAGRHLGGYLFRLLYVVKVDKKGKNGGIKSFIYLIDQPGLENV